MAGFLRTGIELNEDTNALVLLNGSAVAVRPMLSGASLRVKLYGCPAYKLDEACLDFIPSAIQV